MEDKLSSGTGSMSLNKQKPETLTLVTSGKIMTHGLAIKILPLISPKDNSLFEPFHSKIYIYIYINLINLYM
jgi:hypothetical protein